MYLLVNHCGSAHYQGHLPIPAVSMSSQCAAVLYAHRGSAVRGGKKIIFISLWDLKASESDLDIVGLIN